MKRGQSLRFVSILTTKQAYRDMPSAKPRYLDDTFDAIRRQYGPVDQYLQDQLGLDPASRSRLKKSF